MLTTFHAEEERPVYGITTNIDQKANSLHINFHELQDIIRDVREAKGFRQKWFYAFGNPIEVARQKKQMAGLRLLHVTNPEHYSFPPTEGMAISLPTEEVIDSETHRLQQ